MMAEVKSPPLPRRTPTSPFTTSYPVAPGNDCHPSTAVLPNRTISTDVDPAGVRTLSTTPSQLLSRPSQTSGEGEPGTHESTPAVQLPAAAHWPTPHEVAKPSTIPSQSLSRPSQISAAPGWMAALLSLQSP